MLLPAKMKRIEIIVHKDYFDSVMRYLRDVRLVELLDTEWGYDVRHRWLTVTRFWVHDAAATQPLVAES